MDFIERNGVHLDLQPGTLRDKRWVKLYLESEAAAAESSEKDAADNDMPVNHKDKTGRDQR